FLGLSLINGVPIGVKLSNGILKHLLGQEKDLDWTDLEHFDEKMFHTFQGWMDNTSKRGFQMHQTYGLHFVIYDDVSKSEVLLCEHGDQIELTNQNKERYVRLYTKHRLTLNVISQLQSLQKGFWSLFPRSIVHKSLSADHLRQALAGSDDIDIEEWQKHVDYDDCSANDNVIQWFWTYVKSLDKEGLKHLLLFWSGTCSLPLYGFSKSKYSTHKHEQWSIDISKQNQHDPTSLPEASTCDYSLHIPNYSSYDILKSKFDVILQFGYFGYTRS
ncbi:hypothetical protein RFI_31935, partial [Reticulomyxa filosa]